MKPGRSMLVLAVAALVVGAASLYWSADPWGMGVAAAASPPIPEIISNVTAGDGSLSGVRDLESFAAGAGLYMVAAASYGDGILVINVTDPYSPRVISYVADDGATALGGASAVDVVRIGSGTYGVVASASEDGLQVLNLTDPADPVPVAHITDDSMVALAGAYDVGIFAAGSGIYGVVASASDDGLQVLNLTDPADPVPVAHITDDNTVALDGVVAVDTIRIGSGIYAVSASPNDGLQVLNLTDPADPVPVAHITDDTSVHLRGVRGVDTLALGSGTYAVATSDDGLQIVEMTDPSDPVPLARVPDGMHAALRGASAVDTFMMNGGTYAVVAAADGIVVVDLADPAGPMPVETAQDNALHGASAVKAFYVAGHVYAAVAVPDGGGAIRIVSLGEMDSVPPTASSAVWAPADRTLTLVFSEPLDHAATDYPGIILLGESANLTLADAISRTAAGRTISAALGPEQEEALGMPGAVHLYEGAVVDTSANPISHTHLEVTLPDSVPPTVSSATFEPGSGLLTITFSEPLNHTATIYPDIAVAGPIHEDALRISVLIAFLYPDITVADPVHLYTLDEVYIGTTSDMTIQATLDMEQTEAVGSAPMLYMMEGAVVDMWGNPVGAVRGLDVTVLDADALDTTPPALASSSYNTGIGILNITFSEPLNGTAIHYDRMHIRDTGRSTGGLTLDDIASRTLDANSTTITLALSSIQRQTVNALASPQLDIEEGAVSDMSGNGISAASARPVTVIDGISPTVVSAAYEPGTGILVITFSEPLGPAIDYSGINLAGENGNVTLDDVSTKNHLDETITVTLNAAQRITVGDTMTLSVSEGAVADPSNNGIAQTTTSVDVADGIPPTLVSSSYNTGTGILSMTFSEPLGPTIHYDRIAVRDAGRSTGGLTLDDITSRTLDANSTTITLTLSSIQRQMINAMNQPQLDIGMGAVTNIAGNMISAAPDQHITVTDGIPPTVVSVDYTTGTGILVITFSEPLGNVDYSGMSVTGTGGSVALDDAASSHSGDTITAVLDAAQRITAGDSPTLSVSGGAVSDISGNPISPASNIQITVEVTPVLIIPDDPPRDTAPPRLLSSYYTTGTGDLNMTFSEPLLSQINYTGIILVGPSQNLTLDTVTAKNHTIQVINATLDGPQRAIVGERPGLLIEAGAVSDRSGNRIPHTDGTLLVIDGMPPEFVSSYYNTGTGVLNVTFNEPLVPTIHYDRMHVRDVGQAVVGLSLDDVGTKVADPLSSTMTLTLSDTQRRTVNDMATPQLDIDAGAVSDIGRNDIVATPNQPITVIDGIPPTVTSVAYTTGSGILVVVFSEPLDHGATDYSGVSVTGPTNSVALSTVSDKSAAGDRITATLDAAQRSTAGDSPGLSVSAGAVSDIAGNPISSTNPTVTTIDGIPPTISSASYNTGTGILNIRFSETLGSTINYAGFILTGPSDSVALDDVSTKSHSDDTITATLNATQKSTAGDSPTLSVSGGAVADLHGNLVIAATPDLNVIDGIPPTLASSYYNTGTGILNMTFSEPLNGDAIQYGSIAVRETGDSSGGLSLGDVTARAVDPSNKTLTLTLSNAQRQTVNDMATPQLDITADAVADPSGNGISAAPDQRINVIDGIPPTLASSYYNTGTGILNMTFSEPLGVSIDYSGIELAGENGNVALDDVSTKSHSGETISATLNAAQRSTVGDTMTLSVSEGAVADPSDNDIAQTTISVKVTDGIPPTLASSSYNVDTGILNITFSEPLNHTATDYTKLTVVGQPGNVTLDQVATKTPATRTIWATLNAAQMATVGAAPTLAIGEGAVSDPAGNGILQATGTIHITMLGSPIVKIRPVASLTDNGTNTALDGSYYMDGFETDGRTYAVVAGFNDNGIQIVNITDPTTPAPLGSLVDDSTTRLADPQQLDIFEIDGRFYAHVVSRAADNVYTNDGVQIINITDPNNPAPLGSVAEDSTTLLRDPKKADVFAIGNGIYSIVTSVHDRSIQIINITSPASPAPLGSLASYLLNQIYGVKAFSIGDLHYAVTITATKDGIQIINITDPTDPVRGSRYMPTTVSWGENEVDVFEKAGRTYAIFNIRSNDKIQIVDITDPTTPVPRGNIIDDTLDNLGSLKVFTHNERTYVLATAIDWGVPWSRVSLLDITDTANPVLVTSILDDSTTALSGSYQMYIHRAGGSTYATIAAYYDGIQILQLVGKDEIPLEFVSAAYLHPDGIIQATFDKDLNPSLVNTTMLWVSDAGPGGTTLQLNGTGTVVAAANDTLTITLDGAALNTLINMTQPELVIGAGAVSDTDGFPVAAGAHRFTIPDLLPPALTSIYYNTDGLLVLRFSELLNRTATDYSGLTVVGQPGNVTLDQVATRTYAPNTIWATLNATQMETIGDAPSLAIGEGAVRDPAGNRIDGATKTIEVTMLGLPITTIKPVATITDGEDAELVGPNNLDLFEIGSSTYAIVNSYLGDSIQIINLTDPASPSPTASLTDTIHTNLDYPIGVDTFTTGGHTYAVVAANRDDGVQIINITDPASPSPTASITD
ncbi:MAG: hypothetical protein IS632_00820, partial [Thaumarchaeota archaeon]|nr:hypothetical protein [Nitrososphaerota archaeon]